jgi:1-phosphatidylinositol-3-phosphate 5-kinase
MVAMFKYSSVTTYTISVPPQKLEFSGAMKQEWLLKETENVCSIFRHFHVDIS